jgi:hypothetical protein
MIRHIYGVKRTSFFLDESVLQALEAEAGRRGVSVASLVREALAAYVTNPGGRMPLPSITGQFASGHADTSARVDELLWQHPHE